MRLVLLPAVRVLGLALFVREFDGAFASTRRNGRINPGSTRKMIPQSRFYSACMLAAACAVVSSAIILSAPHAGLFTSQCFSTESEIALLLSIPLVSRGAPVFDFAELELP